SPLPLPVLFYRCRGPCARHPFPTRRSSDLVATASARIGDGQDLFSRGIISRANALAAACGVTPGMACKDAAELLKTAPWPHAEPPHKGEDRHIVNGFACVDSSSLLLPEDRGQIVATG